MLNFMPSPDERNRRKRKNANKNKDGEDDEDNVLAGDDGDDVSKCRTFTTELKNG